MHQAGEPRGPQTREVSRPAHPDRYKADTQRCCRSLCVDDVSAMEHELPEFSRVIALCSETVETVWIGYSVGFSLFPLLQPLQRKYLSLLHFYRVLILSSDLTTLHLHESEFAISPDVCLPTLQRLCLTVHALWRVDYTLLSPTHFPSLSSLALCGSGHRLTNDMPELEKLVRQLSTLVIGSIRNVNQDLSGLPLPILANSLSLRRLVFGDGMTNLETTLVHLPSKLQSLHILVRTMSEGPRVVEYLIKSPPPCLSELRYLSLRGDPERFVEMREGNGLEKIVKIWEERKVHVSTGGMEQSVYAAWDNFLE